MSGHTTLRVHLEVAADAADEKGFPVWAMLMRDASAAIASEHAALLVEQSLHAVPEPDEQEQGDG